MSDTGIDVVPKLPKFPVPVLKYVPVPVVPLSISYRTYRKVSGTGIDVAPNIPVSGTGIDVVPNLPTYPVPVMPTVYTSVRTVPNTP